MEKPATPLHFTCEEVVAGNGTNYYQACINGDDIAHGNNGLMQLVSQANAYPHLTAINAELVEALHNMVALARPHFSDAPQMLALELSERALARAMLTARQENSNGH